MTTMLPEDYFGSFRDNIIGGQRFFDSPFGPQRLVYADWTASGRGYGPIEEFLQAEILPFFGNTHTSATVTGTKMTLAYEQAKVDIKDHVGADADDVLLFCGSGMTSAVCKLQRILGLRVPDRFMQFVTRLDIDEALRPVVFVTHMEHHSNHISWLETIADVELFADLEELDVLLRWYRHRKTKIAAVTACSNVTGIQTAYHAIAALVHAHGGLCFVDFACSAPYVAIDMHPGGLGGLPGAGHCGGPVVDLGAGPNADLDAIYFSCHKFLGGPGTPGVLIFNKRLYGDQAPDHPGGGTILYSNPWKGRDYIADIEQREDGGTPPVLQAIKAGMCIRLKEEMGVGPMLARESALKDMLLDRLLQIEGIDVLEPFVTDRLGIVSFTVRDMHYNEVVRQLNDRFGIQSRGGCSCAGTYGHVLLGIDRVRSAAIRGALLSGDMESKPGWVRLSLHPTMTEAEVDYIADAVELTVGELAGLSVVRS